MEEVVIDECYVESANDPANQYHYCGHIKNIYIRGDCYGEMAAVANKPDICDELLNSSKDPEFLQGRCYVNYVKGYYNRQWGDFRSRYRHHDEYFCSKIVDLPRSYSSDGSPQYLKDWCYSIVASVKKNPDLCLRISNLEDQDSCVRNMSPSK